tara:strand:- start:359 stop:745 length:387 start_codon:yes stop_codon:yes gene_type:complete
MQYLCPNCGSNDYLSKHSIGRNFTQLPYSNVNSEIQCAKCFIDIPSNLCEDINPKDINLVKKAWFEDYKPVHLKHASRCSNCSRFYWEIEKFFSENKIKSKDIFYQTYNPQKGVGNLICKICDPTSFK